MSTQAGAEAVFSDVSDQAEKIANNAEQVYEIVDIGDEIRQGDIYITRIAAVPDGATLVKEPEKQLAPGNTQGSRHCLRSLDGVTAYRVTSSNPLDGPILDARSGIAIDHPEHANVVLPAGVYAITYQRAFGDELRAVQD